MSDRIDIATKMQVDGKSYSLFLLTNPTIEDVLSLEMRLYAGEVQSSVVNTERRVDRDIRDFLIKLGVST